uniref:BTB domain-containing protein n=1 Tax=Panagrellus redivivus TaxID=6233 RepID=A0A7E4ZRQ4_PANRE
MPPKVSFYDRPEPTLDMVKDSCAVKIRKRKPGLFDLFRDPAPKLWRKVPSAPILEWSVVYFFDSEGESYKGKQSIDIEVSVNKPVRGNLKFTYANANYEKCVDNIFFNEPFRTTLLFLPKGTYRRNMSISCDIEFDCYPLSMAMSRYICIPPKSGFDFEIHVGDRCIKAHRQFLSKISPVFNAMLTHNMLEAQSGKLNIVDFDFGVVNIAIDICYGLDFVLASTADIVNLLTFADKYDIRFLMWQLENHIRSIKICAINFVPLLRYAWIHSHELLKSKCAECYDANREIIATSEFVNLPDTIVVEFLRYAV